MNPVLRAAPSVLFLISAAPALASAHVRCESGRDAILSRLAKQQGVLARCGRGAAARPTPARNVAPSPAAVAAPVATAAPAAPGATRAPGPAGARPAVATAASNPDLASAPAVSPAR